jgi:septal ring factor EnvC (AmiA/AmiB activator)
MLCAGTTESIKKFLQYLKENVPEYVEIDQFTKTEIPIPEDIDLNIPPHFLKLETEDLSDINRKLDIGIDHLKTLPDIYDNTSGIKQSVSSLPDIKSGIDNLNSKFDDFIVEQKEHNKRMDQYIGDIQEHNKKLDTRLDRMDQYLENQQEHNQRLEKILQKLSEK